jgi:hypothetical protein
MNTHKPVGGTTRLAHRRLLKVYLEALDFEALAARAREAGKAVSEYTRRLILEDLASRTMPGAATEPAQPEAIAISAEVQDVPTRKSAPNAKSGARACAHGTKAGYRCWQCGGLAQIGG